MEEIPGMYWVLLLIRWEQTGTINLSCNLLSSRVGAEITMDMSRQNTISRRLIISLRRCSSVLFSLRIISLSEQLTDGESMILNYMFRSMLQRTQSLSEIHHRFHCR